MKYNPYNYNLPVGPEMFFGRQDDVEILLHHLTTVPGDSFALIGGRRMGKTSLLEALLRALEQKMGDHDSDLLSLPIFLDLTGEGIDSAHDFFGTVIKRAQIGLSGLLCEDWGETSAQEWERPPGPHFAQILRRWQTALQNGNRLRMVLLLDECEQIVDHPWTSDLYSALRYLLVGRTTKHLFKVVMCGSHRFLTQVRQKGSPLRNVLKYHRLRVLDGQSTRNLVTQPIDAVLSGRVVQAVVEQSGGHPFLTQYLMHHLHERGLETATSKVVDAISAEFSHERNDFQAWLDVLGNASSAVYSLLISTGEPIGERQIRDTLSISPLEVARAIDGLCYHGLIVREQEDNVYQIAGQMFRRWFETCFPKNPQPDVVKRSKTNQEPAETPSNFKYDLFISYSPDDRDWVHQTLLPRLEDENLRICIEDRDFKPGKPRLVNIEQAVKHSRKTLIVLTPAWIEDKWKEFEALLLQSDDPAGRKGRMIPLRLKPCEAPRRIDILTEIDFTQPSEDESQLQRLIAVAQNEDQFDQRSFAPESIESNLCDLRMLVVAPSGEKSFSHLEFDIPPRDPSKKSTCRVEFVLCLDSQSSSMKRYISIEMQVTSDNDAFWMYDYDSSPFLIEASPRPWKIHPPSKCIQCSFLGGDDFVCYGGSQQSLGQVRMLVPYGQANTTVTFRYHIWAQRYETRGKFAIVLKSKR